MTLVWCVSELRPTEVISLIIAHKVKSGWEPDIAVSFDVSLTYIAMIELNGISILREVADRLYKTAKVFLHFDAPDFFLTITVHFSGYIVFGLKKSILDISPWGILERE